MKWIECTSLKQLNVRNHWLRWLTLAGQGSLHVGWRPLFHLHALMFVCLGEPGDQGSPGQAGRPGNDVSSKFIASSESWWKKKLDLGSTRRTRTCGPIGQLRPLSSSSSGPWILRPLVHRLLWPAARNHFMSFKGHAAELTSIPIFVSTVLMSASPPAFFGWNRRILSFILLHLATCGKSVVSLSLLLLS